MPSVASSRSRYSIARTLLTSALLLAGGALLAASPAAAQGISAPQGLQQGASANPGPSALSRPSRAIQPAEPLQSAGSLQPRLSGQQGATAPQPDSQQSRRPGASGTQIETGSPPPYRHRWDAFRRGAVGNVLVGGALLGTQMYLFGRPSTWNQDTGGYLARIVGSGVESQLVSRSVQRSVAALDLRLKTPDPQQGSLGTRMGKAAFRALTIRTVSGQRVPAVGKLSGRYASILAQQRLHTGQWQPGQAAVSTAIGAGLSAVWAAGGELVESL